jgi:hypothetical protein
MQQETIVRWGTSERAMTFCCCISTVPQCRDSGQACPIHSCSSRLAGVPGPDQGEAVKGRLSTWREPEWRGSAVHGSKAIWSRHCGRRGCCVDVVCTRLLCDGHFGAVQNALPFLHGVSSASDTRDTLQRGEMYSSKEYVNLSLANQPTKPTISALMGNN